MHAKLEVCARSDETLLRVWLERFGNFRRESCELSRANIVFVLALARFTIVLGFLIGKPFERSVAQATFNEHRIKNTFLETNIYSAGSLVSIEHTPSARNEFILPHAITCRRV